MPGYTRGLPRCDRVCDAWETCSIEPFPRKLLKGECSLDLPRVLIQDEVTRALLEDLGRAGDLSTQATIDPEKILVNPKIECKTVDLPAPFGPIKHND